MKIQGRIAVVMAAVGLSALLGGCNNVSKSKYELAMQEASELRSRNEQLESSLRERDLKLADCESRLASAQVQAPVIVTGAATGSPVAYPSGNDGDFRQQADGSAVADIAGNVLFDSGSATVKSSGRSTLNRIADQLKGKYSGRAVRVEGHTDSDPIKRSKWSSNDQLSQARADAVASYLRERGVSSSRMDAVGYGSSRPKGTKAASRRVEIVVLAN